MEECQELRILMVTVRADYGGGPEHVYRLIDNMPDTIQVYVACPYDKPYWERYSSKVGKQQMLELPHRRFTFWHLFSLLNFVYKNDIQIIHSHGKGAGIYGRILALLTRRISIHTFHGIHVGNYNMWQKSLYILLERLLSVLSKYLITVSEGESSKIKELKLCNNEKLVLIKNGVKIPTEMIDTNIRKNPKRKVISMSRFDYAKNSDLIIPILENLKIKGRLHEFEFVFLGTGEGQAELQKKLKLNGLSDYVVFQGAVSNPEKFLQEAFCYLSTSRWEGLPLGVIEAMAVGVPVIATDVVGNRDVIINSKTGFLYDIVTPEMAGEYLINLADDLNLWRKMSKKSRGIAIKQYSVTRMAIQTSNLYYKAMALKVVE